MSFSIRLDNKPRTLDFRTGNNGWGHCLHGNTWTRVEPRVEGPFWRRKIIDRVQVTVHCRDPRVGDILLYDGKSGLTRKTVIVVVDSYGDPDDMFDLTLEEVTE